MKYQNIVVVLLTLLVAGCGNESGSGPSEVERSRSGAITGIWQYTGTGFGNFRSATLEIREDYIQIDAICADSRGTVFSPIELRSSSIVVKETHASATPCVAALTKGEKNFSISGDSLILEGILGSSRWRR